EPENENAEKPLHGPLKITRQGGGQCKSTN
ncbi:hypothetical protein B14911_22457, partial [Bacillus sp. NRRL B-14911]